MTANLLTKLASLTVVASLTVAAQAALIAPNTPSLPGVPLGAGTSFGADPTLGGVVVANQVVSFVDVSPVPSFTGTLRSVVVRNGAGLLDFYYQLANTSTPQINFDQEFFRVSIAGFNGFGFGATDLLDVNYRTDGLTGISGAGVVNLGTVNPTTGDRDIGIPGGNGGVGFGFGTFLDQPALNVDPGEVSRFLVIRTQATAFVSENNISIVSGAGTGLAASFRPAAVPEPGTALAGLIALGVCGTARRRRPAQA